MDMYTQMLMYVLLWSVDTMPFHVLDMVRSFAYADGYVIWHSWLGEDSVLLLWVWMYVRLWTFLDARLLWSLTMDVFIAHVFSHFYYALPDCFVEC